MGNIIAILLIALIGYMVAVAVIRAISRLYWRVVSDTETLIDWATVKLSSIIKSTIEETKSTVKEIKETIKEKPEPTAPDKGKRTIKQMIVNAMIILSLWIVSLVVVVAMILSNFNFAIGAY